MEKKYRLVTETGRILLGGETYNHNAAERWFDDFNGNGKIVFTGSIEDCNRKCIELNSLNQPKRSKIGASAAGWSPGSDDGRPERENMTTLKFENNKIYSTSTLCEKTDVFEIVEKIPVGFFVWNIGENMGTHEYIPVCEDLHPEYKDNYEINTATLKAVKVTPDEWKKLDKAASWGVGNLKQAEKALKSKRKGYTADRKRAAAELTIEIFRRICEQSKPPPGGLQELPHLH